MDRPPRPVDEPLFTSRVLGISIAQGATVFLAVFVVYLMALASGESEAGVRGLTFTALVLGNLGLILVNRSWSRSAIAGLVTDRNRSLFWVLGGAVACLFSLQVIPWLRTLFRFAEFSLLDLLAVLVASIAGVAWFEIYKLVRAARKQSVGGE